MKLTPAVLSSSFEGVSELTSIKMDHRDISHIDDISFLVNLKKLDLSHNRLRAGESLSGLQYCKSLTWLDLSHNQLGDIRHVLGLRNLAVLNVSHNELQGLPEGLAQLGSLRALIVSDNQIRTLAGVRLPRGLTTVVLSRNGLEADGGAFARLEGLEKLSLSHNRLRAWPELGRCWGLRELRLNQNRLLTLPTAAGALPPALAVVDVGHNAVERVEELDGLVRLRHLVSLTVAGNPFWEAGCEARLTAAIPTLRTLNSRRCVR